MREMLFVSKTCRADARKESAGGGGEGRGEPHFPSYPSPLRVERPARFPFSLSFLAPATQATYHRDPQSKSLEVSLDPK